jgi:hypothetical protein
MALAPAQKQQSNLGDGGKAGREVIPGFGATERLVAAMDGDWDSGEARATKAMDDNETVGDWARRKQLREWSGNIGRWRWQSRRGVAFIHNDVVDCDGDDDDEVSI